MLRGKLAAEKRFVPCLSPANQPYICDARPKVSLDSELEGEFERKIGVPCDDWGEEYVNLRLPRRAGRSAPTTGKMWSFQYLQLIPFYYH